MRATPRELLTLCKLSSGRGKRAEKWDWVCLLSQSRAAAVVFPESFRVPPGASLSPPGWRAIPLLGAIIASSPH